MRGRKGVALLLLTAMVFTIPQTVYATEISSNTIVQDTSPEPVTNLDGEEEPTGRSNPFNPIYADGAVSATYDYVYFGSYPQTEIKIGANRLSNNLLGASYTAENDYTTTIDGVKYRGLNKELATYYVSATDYFVDPSNYFDWKTAGYESAHYFKYEPIRWRVLKNDGTNLYLLAENALDCQKYNTSESNVTWENSSLRSYLNNEFLNRAFSTAEKSIINTDIVVNNGNKWYPGVPAQNNTLDKVYLLSVDEIVKPEYGFTSGYSLAAEPRRSIASAYAKAMGTYSHTVGEGAGNCIWWLRSPGRYPAYGAFTRFEGVAVMEGDNVKAGLAVRPVISIPLASNLWSNDLEDFSGYGEGDLSLSATTVSGDKLGAVVNVKNVKNAMMEEAKNAILEVYVSENTIPTFTKSLGTISANQEVTESILLNPDWFPDNLSTASVTFGVRSDLPDIDVSNDEAKLSFALTRRVTFDSQGGSVVAPKDIWYGDTLTLPEPTKAQYRLKGWYTKPKEKGIKFTKDMPIQSDVTLYAYWILDSEAHSISEANVDQVKDQIYAKDALTPVPTVKYKTTSLIEGTDYTLSYENNINVGTAKMILKGKGNYSGTKEVTFQITQKNIAKTAIEVYDATETGADITPAVVIMEGGTKLVQGTDYKITGLTNNKKPGKGSFTISGNGNYTGSVKKTFTIYAKGVTPVADSTISMNGSDTVYVYTGSAIKPVVEVKDISGNKVDAKNYTVQYKNNRNAGIASILIKGKGKQYKGSKTLYFTIQPKNITQLCVMENIADQSFTGGAVTPIAKVVVKATNKMLSNKKDYVMSYEDNIITGEATATVTGKGNYTGTLSGKFTINQVELGKGFTVKGLTPQKYNGSPVEPGFILLYKKNTLVKGRDYTVSFANNTQIGKATLTITAISGSSLKGTMTKTFKIKK